MLIFRLTFVLLIIAAMVMFGVYMLADDKKYLRYFKQILKYMFFMLVALAVLFVSRRLLAI
ncbi:MAG: hypothetical protein V4445_02685 [Pseudomonadota bacterium]